MQDAPQQAVTLTLDNEIAVIAISNPPVNALGVAVREGLRDALIAAEKAGVRGALIYAEGRTFPAGADIREFGKPPAAPLLPDLCTQIERAPLLVVAALHGTALGGGLELALAADYRIAVPGTQLGLPEVTLGILPGAGGTQRLPRLTGVEAALDLITSGRRVAAQEALALGVLDRVAEGTPRALGLAYLRDLLAEGAPRRPVGDKPNPAPVDFDAAYAATLKKARGQLSPAYAVRAVQAACELPFDAGLARERALFNELMQTDQRAALIHAFFGERAVSNLPELQGVSARELCQVGVVGGGTMGAGIATAALLSGLGVTLLERDAEAAEAARARIAANLEGARKRGKIDAATLAELTTQALTLATGYEALAHADLVIEAVFEDMALKQEVFAALDRACKPGAVLATNTSYLDINEIAAATARPADVIGLHFFSPAHVMKLLEVVVANHTAPDVVATGFALGKRLGKVAVRAGVCDGFIGNRILQAYRAAADHMVLDGASPFEIDRAVRDFGFAMGPFEVADLAGLDIGWATRKRLAPTRDPRARVPTYADKLCEAGHLGRKTGQGYYIYGDGPPRENPQVRALIDQERKALGLTPRAFEAEEIMRRYMGAMVNEAARVVGEGIARRPLDVDIVLLTGYGFPRHRGGPMKWADQTGLPAVLADIAHFAEADAYFWQPAPLLVSLAEAGQCFDDLNR